MLTLGEETLGFSHYSEKCCRQAGDGWAAVSLADTAVRGCDDEQQSDIFEHPAITLVALWARACLQSPAHHGPLLLDINTTLPSCAPKEGTYDEGRYHWAVASRTHTTDRLGLRLKFEM
jgi:hypothetical protein